MNERVCDELLIYTRSSGPFSAVRRDECVKVEWLLLIKKKYLHFSLRDDMFHQFIHSALLLFASLHDVCCAMT